MHFCWIKVADQIFFAYLKLTEKKIFPILKIIRDFMELIKSTHMVGFACMQNQTFHQNKLKTKNISLIQIIFWIKLKLDSNTSIVVGAVYRHGPPKKGEDKLNEFQKQFF